MNLDRDGLPAIAIAAVPSAVAALAGRRRLALALGALPVGIAAFFRDPDRTPDREPYTDPDLVVAPADAKVMSVGPAEAGVGPVGEWQHIVTFLSAADVHVNRTPYGGVVRSVTYRPGRFLPAYTAESGAENERSEVTIVRHVDGEERVLVFRQIVGIMARRVVTRVEPGDRLLTGQRIGLMKFGSRMDVFVPPEVEVLVAKGDRTVAGETPIARWPASGSASRSAVGDRPGAVGA